MTKEEHERQARTILYAIMNVHEHQRVGEAWVIWLARVSVHARTGSLWSALEPSDPTVIRAAEYLRRLHKGSDVETAARAVAISHGWIPIDPPVATGLRHSWAGPLGPDALAQFIRREVGSVA